MSASSSSSAVGPSANLKTLLKKIDKSLIDDILVLAELQHLTEGAPQEDKDALHTQTTRIKWMINTYIAYRDAESHTPRGHQSAEDELVDYEERLNGARDTVYRLLVNETPLERMQPETTALLIDETRLQEGRLRLLCNDYMYRSNDKVPGLNAYFGVMTGAKVALASLKEISMFGRGFKNIKSQAERNVFRTRWATVYHYSTLLERLTPPGARVLHRDLIHKVNEDTLETFLRGPIPAGVDKPAIRKLMKQFQGDMSFPYRLIYELYDNFTGKEPFYEQLVHLYVDASEHARTIIDNNTNWQIEVSPFPIPGSEVIDGLVDALQYLSGAFGSENQGELATSIINDTRRFIDSVAMTASAPSRDVYSSLVQRITRLAEFNSKLVDRRVKDDEEAGLLQTLRDWPYGAAAVGRLLDILDKRLKHYATSMARRWLVDAARLIYQDARMRLAFLPNSTQDTDRVIQCIDLFSSKENRISTLEELWGDFVFEDEDDLVLEELGAVFAEAASHPNPDKTKYDVKFVTAMLQNRNSIVREPIHQMLLIKMYFATEACLQQNVGKHSHETELGLMSLWQLLLQQFQDLHTGRTVAPAIAYAQTNTDTMDEVKNALNSDDSANAEALRLYGEMRKHILTLANANVARAAFNQRRVEIERRVAEVADAVVVVPAAPVVQAAPDVEMQEAVFPGPGADVQEAEDAADEADEEEALLKSIDEKEDWMALRFIKSRGYESALVSLDTLVTSACSLRSDTLVPPPTLLYCNCLAYDPDDPKDNTNSKDWYWAIGECEYWATKVSKTYHEQNMENLVRKMIWRGKYRLAATAGVYILYRLHSNAAREGAKTRETDWMMSAQALSYLIRKSSEDDLLQPDVLAKCIRQTLLEDDTTGHIACGEICIIAMVESRSFLEQGEEIYTPVLERVIGQLGVSIRRVDFSGSIDVYSDLACIGSDPNIPEYVALLLLREYLSSREVQCSDLVMKILCGKARPGWEAEAIREDLEESPEHITTWKTTFITIMSRRWRIARALTREDKANRVQAYETWLMEREARLPGAEERERLDPKNPQTLTRLAERERLVSRAERAQNPEWTQPVVPSTHSSLFTRPGKPAGEHITFLATFIPGLMLITSEYYNSSETENDLSRAASDAFHRVATLAALHTDWSIPGSAQTAIQLIRGSIRHGSSPTTRRAYDILINAIQNAASVTAFDSYELGSPPPASIQRNFQPQVNTQLVRRMGVDMMSLVGSYLEADTRSEGDTLQYNSKQRQHLARIQHRHTTIAQQKADVVAMGSAPAASRPKRQAEADVERELDTSSRSARIREEDVVMEDAAEEKEREEKWQ